jgi:hypothetical protein
MTERLDPEVKRLLRLSPGDLADEAIGLKEPNRGYQKRGDTPRLEDR